MRKYILACTILALSVLTTARLYGEVVDKIEVVVNDDVITQSEIDRLVAPIYEQYKSVYSGEELVKKLVEARQKVVEQLIEDELLLAEAKKLNIEVSDKEVDAKIEEARQRIGSKERFEQALAEQHVTLKDLKTRYKEQFMVRKMIDQKVGSKVVITPVEVDAYYHEHLKSFVQPEEVKLRNILIKVHSDPRKARDLARDILEKLRAGRDFAELAKAHSEGPNEAEGGMMGYIKKGDLIPEIETVIFNLKEGDISDIIQSSLGYHIFMVEDKRAARIPSVSEVRRDIEDEIFKTKARDKIQEWVQGLKKNAYIAFK